MGLILLGILAYINKAQEAKRLEKNNAELTKKNASVIALELTTKELKEYVQQNYGVLEAKLDSANIKARNVERIVVQNYYYRDTTSRKVDLQPIVEAIKGNIKMSVPVLDQSPCLVISGFMEYDGERLQLNITDRQFTSIDEVVAHAERRQWKLLGILPTRLLGKKETKITVFNNCGESKTIVLSKKK